MTTLIKLGGSLVTDKRRAKSFRRGTVQAIAREISELRALQPERRIVLGHGSGSFGHYEAQKHNTIDGVHTDQERLGFARVGAVASELGQLIVRELLAASLPALRFQPSAMQIARNRSIAHIDLRALKLALDNQLLPLVHGDIALDETIGGTIISTESLFARLVKPLDVRTIVLLGDVDGVLDLDDHVLPLITPDSQRQHARLLGIASGYDVTGGMQQKVNEMLGLARRYQDLTIVIANGNLRGILLDLLVNGAALGTRISAR